MDGCEDVEDWGCEDARGSHGDDARGNACGCVWDWDWDWAAKAVAAMSCSTMATAKVAAASDLALDILLTSFIFRCGLPSILLIISPIGESCKSWDGMRT